MEDSGPRAASHWLEAHEQALWPGLAAALPGSLLLPWSNAHDDGEAFKVFGVETEPGFALGTLGCAAGVWVAGLSNRPITPSRAQARSGPQR